MLILTMLRLSLNLCHMHTKPRSPGHILEKPCNYYIGHPLYFNLDETWLECLSLKYLGHFQIGVKCVQKVGLQVKCQKFASSSSLEPSLHIVHVKFIHRDLIEELLLFIYIFILARK